MKIQITFDTTSDDEEEPAALSIEEATAGEFTPLLVRDGHVAVFEFKEDQEDEFFMALDKHGWCFKDPVTLNEGELAEIRQILDDEFAASGVEFSSAEGEITSFLQVATEAVQELGYGGSETGEVSMATVDAVLAPIHADSRQAELREIAGRIAGEIRAANDGYNSSLDDPNDLMSGVRDLRPEGY